MERENPKFLPFQKEKPVVGEQLFGPLASLFGPDKSSQVLKTKRCLQQQKKKKKNYFQKRKRKKLK